VSDTRNYEEAVRMYRKAAKQGDCYAQGSLGVMYDRGHGVTQDLREAFKWYRKAANQGYANVQSLLGHMYAVGRGVMHDDIMAYVWFNVAAMNKDDDAIENRDHVSKRLSESDLKKAQKLSKHCDEKPASCPKYSGEQRQRLGNPRSLT
jgi:TPR repeat protein